MLSDVGDPYLYDEECDRDGEHPIGEDLYSSSFALPSAARSDWSPSLCCHPLVCITCDAGRNAPTTRKRAPRERDALIFRPTAGYSIPNLVGR
jgi:hypothetical protein